MTDSYRVARRAMSARHYDINIEFRSYTDNPLRRDPRDTCRPCECFIREVATSRISRNATHLAFSFLFFFNLNGTMVAAGLLVSINRAIFIPPSAPSPPLPTEAAIF